MIRRNRPRPTFDYPREGRLACRAGGSIPAKGCNRIAILTGQDKSKSTALSWLALGPYFSAVCRNNILGDRQTQPGALRHVTRLATPLVKFFKNRSQAFRRNSGP